jgi:hypothetical protein
MNLRLRNVNIFNFIVTPLFTSLDLNILKIIHFLMFYQCKLIQMSLDLNFMYLKDFISQISKYDDSCLWMLECLNEIYQKKISISDYITIYESYLSTLNSRIFSVFEIQDCLDYCWKLLKQRHIFLNQLN